MGGVALIALVAGAWYFGLFDTFRYTYRAEVGYYTGERQDWFVGTDKSYDDCMSEAIWRFNAFNVESKGRAFSWACRKMLGERFLERVR